MSERKHRLVDCNPRWVSYGGVEKRGLSFECPEGHEGCRYVIPFTPDLAGNANPGWQKNGCVWQRTGDTFDTLTLSPSILMTPTRATDGHVVDPCALHIFITNGAITFCGDSK